MSEGRHPDTNADASARDDQKSPALPPKLIRPCIPRACGRQRLFDELTSKLEHAAIWVAAAPGSGKTVLVSSYADSRKQPCFWYRIDSRDRDPATLFHYLRRLAMAAAPERAGVLPHLTFEYMAGIETYARNFFEHFFECFEPRTILVLDNCQDFGKNSTTASLLATGLERAPQSLDLILTSRERPGPAFARLLTSERLHVIGGSELELSGDEASQIAHYRFPDGIPTERVDEILGQTKGWMAGFTLLLEQPPEKGTQTTIPDGHLFDYFASEVLATLEPALLDLLLQGAWLPRMPARLLHLQCEDEHAAERISELCRRNYFVSGSGGENPVYEIHPLFRECLLQHSRESWSPERLDSVRQRAAKILTDDAQYEDALELLLQLANWQSAAEIIIAHAPAWFMEGRMQIVALTLASIPDREIEARPWLLFWQATCQLPFDLTQARQRFALAEQSFHARGESMGQLLACTAVLESYFHERGDFHPLDEWMRKLETLLANNPQLLDDAQIEARVTAAMFASFMARRPGSADFRPWITRAEKLIIHTSNDLFKLGLATHLVAYYSWWTGDSERAKAIVDVIEPTRQSLGNNPLNHIVWSGVSALNQWTLLDFSGCINNAQNGLKIADSSGIHLWDFLLLAQCTWGAIFAGNDEQAEGYLAQMAAALQPGHYLDASQYHFQRFIVALRHNDSAAMNVHSDAALRYARSAGDPWAEGLCLVARARTQAADGDMHAAQELLSQAETRVQGDAGNTIAYAVRLTRAELACDPADPDSGLVELRGLFALARATNIVYSNWERDEIMADLCLRALEHDIETEFVCRLARLRHLVPSEPPLHLDNWPWPLDIDTLGHFEVRVDGRALHFDGKSQKRPLALLKALIALGGQDVAESRLADALWPDAEGDAAQQSLATTLHRLRQLIGNETVQRHDGVMSLDPAMCRTDLWTCQRHLDQVEAALPDQAAAAHAAVRSALKLYKGPFLDGDADAAWALPTRERLRDRLLHSLIATARVLHTGGDDENALACYDQALQMEPLAEQAWRGLMRCHLNNGHHAAGLAAYKRCAEALQRGLGVSPSDDTEALHRALARH